MGGGDHPGPLVFYRVAAVATAVADMAMAVGCRGGLIPVLGGVHHARAPDHARSSRRALPAWLSGKIPRIRRHSTLRKYIEKTM